VESISGHFEIFDVYEVVLGERLFGDWTDSVFCDFVFYEPLFEDEPALDGHDGGLGNVSGYCGFVDQSQSEGVGVAYWSRASD